ncbi:hypothetical protein HMPREF1275_00917 [Propionibacterium sp. KPL1844]|nr:hypothetical protein HMPREF1275_00917 [Propionibacterium sp. KPL1844]
MRRAVAGVAAQDRRSDDVEDVDLDEDANAIVGAESAARSKARMRRLEVRLSDDEYDDVAETFGVPMAQVIRAIPGALDIVLLKTLERAARRAKQDAQQLAEVRSALEEMTAAYNRLESQTRRVGYNLMAINRHANQGHGVDADALTAANEEQDLLQQAVAAEGEHVSQMLGALAWVR